MANSRIDDPEFGAVTVRRTKLARAVKLKIDQRGVISISMPMRTPLFLARTLLHEARQQIRRNLTKISTERAILQHGDLIGKSHRLIITTGYELKSRINGTELHITLIEGQDVTSVEAQNFIRESALKALRTQAKAYLTRRLQMLAETHGFAFVSIRFGNAGTRWGSCSSNGTISLNIWLMQLPFELIDYVLIHELCHTKQMNHSTDFWNLVEAILPSYRELRRDLKLQKPYI